MYQSIPAVISSIPITSTGRGPILVVNACDNPATMTTVPAVKRKVSPVFTAE